MAQTTIDGNAYVNGSLSCRSFTPPSGCITDAAVQAGAGMDATKLEHQHQPVVADPYATTTADFRQVIHVVRGTTGSIVRFEAGISQVITGDSTVAVQLKVNGTNVLTAAITLDSSSVALETTAAAGFTSTDLAQGDVIEVDVDATVGTGTLSKGFFAMLTVHEDSQ